MLINSAIRVAESYTYPMVIKKTVKENKYKILFPDTRSSEKVEGTLEDMFEVLVAGLSGWLMYCLGEGYLPPPPTPVLELVDQYPNGLVMLVPSIMLFGVDYKTADSPRNPFVDLLNAVEKYGTYPFNLQGGMSR